MANVRRSKFLAKLLRHDAQSKGLVVSSGESFLQNYFRARETKRCYYLINCLHFYGFSHPTLKKFIYCSKCSQLCIVCVLVITTIMLYVQLQNMCVTMFNITILFVLKVVSLILRYFFSNFKCC